MVTGSPPAGFEDVSTLADCFVGRPGDPVPVGPADESPALRVGRDGPISYDGSGFRGEVCKTGNLFSHLGIREGRTLAIVDEPLVQPILGFLGASLLGAVVRFVPVDLLDGKPTGSAGDPRLLDARGLLAPTERLPEFDLPPGGQRIGYGDAPTDPGVTFFEKEMWSENPIFPPPTVVPDDGLLAVGGDEAGSPGEVLTHADLLDAAGAVVADRDLGSEDAVVIRSSFVDPGTVVAGVLAPIVAGGTIVLPDQGTGSLGTVAVGVGDGPEDERIDPADVPI